MSRSDIELCRTRVSYSQLMGAVFMGLLLADAALVAWLQMLTVTSNLVISSVLIIFLPGIGLLVHHRALTFLIKLLLVCLAGGAGMLVGCIVDFGQYGMINLASMCVAIGQVSIIDAVGQMFRIAPWTHIGMLVSCSLALVVVDRDAARAENIACRGLKHGLCVVGMMLGMWAVGVLPRGWIVNIGISSVFDPITRMWIGMSVGMIVPIVLIDRRRMLYEYYIRLRDALWEFCRNVGNTK